MGVQCQILLNPPADGVYKPGGTVSGSVKYAVDAPFEYEDLYISLDGEGISLFASLRPSVTFSQLCMGEHDFVREIKSLFPGNQHGDHHILPVGTYEEDFSFKLPLNIPMPYKDKICKLTYQVKCTFRKPTLFGHKEFSAPIDVFAYVKPEQSEGSIPFELEKTLYRPFSQKTHTINVKGEISNTFFKPGGNADLSFKVTNDTDTDVYSIETKLVCYTIYKGDCGRTKENVTIIQENAVETPGVPANGIANLTSVMKVPEHLFSIQNCNVIKKQYRVRVTMRLYMPYTNAYTEIPVVIGHKSDDNSENTEVVNAVTKNTESSATSFALEKTLFKFFSYKIQTIKLKGEISNTIFTAGETADLSFTVTNDTDTPIRSVETKLVCFTTMGHPENNKPSEVVVIESAVETVGVPANGVANLSSIMPIPTHVHTREFGVSLSIQYKVRVTVKLFFPYTNASTEFPVVIREKGREQEIPTRNNNEKQKDSLVEESEKEVDSKIKPEPVDVEDNKNSEVTGIRSGNPSSDSLEVALEVKEENENFPSS